MRIAIVAIALKGGTCSEADDQRPMMMVVVQVTVTVVQVVRMMERMSRMKWAAMIAHTKVLVAAYMAAVSSMTHVTGMSTAMTSTVATATSTMAASMTTAVTSTRISDDS